MSREGKCVETESWLVVLRVAVEMGVVTVIFSFTPVSEGTNRKLFIPPTSQPWRKGGGLDPISCIRRANKSKSIRGAEDSSENDEWFSAPVWRKDVVLWVVCWGWNDKLGRDVFPSLPSPSGQCCNSPAKQCLRGHANFAAASPSGSKSQWEPDVQLVNTRFAILPHHFSAEPPSSPASRRLKKAVQITAGQHSPFPKRWSSEA